ACGTGLVAGERDKRDGGQGNGDALHEISRIRWDVEPLRVWARGGFGSAVDVAFLFETRNDPKVTGGRHQTRGHVPQVSSNGLSVDFHLPIPSSAVAAGSARPCTERPDRRM